MQGEMAPDLAGGSSGFAWGGRWSIWSPRIISFLKGDVMFSIFSLHFRVLRNVNRDGK